MKTTHHSSIEPLEARIAPAFAAVVDLSTLVTIQGAAANDTTGVAVSIAGDLNADGFDDIIIGAPDADPHGSASGTSYVIFGRAGGLASIDLSTLAAGAGFKIQGEAAGDKAGFSVSGAGDVNKDGFDDLIIGAPKEATNGSNGGAAYVVFGKAGAFPLAFDLSTLNGANGFKLLGKVSGQLFIGEQAGFAVSAAGDVNGDGFADVFVGAPFGDSGLQGTGSSGIGYVVFGKASGFAAASNLSALNGSNGFKIGGNIFSTAGSSVSRGGDINGDGRDDLLISDPAGMIKQGYVIYGAPNFASTVSPANLNGTNGAILQGTEDGTGGVITTAGDINGDGFADVLIGARYADPNGVDSGTSYVVFGKSGGLASPLNLATMTSAQGFKINGLAAGDKSGSALSAAGDVNGDGFDDLLVGSSLEDANGTDAGAARVIFGKAGSFGTKLELSSLNGANGFTLKGAAAGDFAGSALSGAGDLNGDGFDDLLIGAPKHAASGATYIFYGGNGGKPAVISANGKTATFTDLDGDRVTIKSSKGRLTADEFTLTGRNALGGLSLSLVDLHGHGELKHANLTIKAVPQLLGGVLLGDGLVNVSELDTSGVDVGKVKVGGDLGQFRLSSPDSKAAAKSLTVRSLGHEGFRTQGALSSLLSTTLGTLPKLTVKTTVEGVFIAGSKFGAVTVGGDFTNSKLVPFGEANPTNAAHAVALASFTVGGNLEASQILAGPFPFGGNADVAIGKVTVKGNWQGSDLAAGVSAGADGVYGTADDALFSGGNAIISRIASVVIKGEALGIVAPGGHFGIVAEQIGAVSIHQIKVPLHQNAKDHFLALGAGGDFFLNEV